MIALHYATITYHEDVYQLLLDAGSDMSKKDCFGMTASGYHSDRMIELSKTENGG